MAECAFYTLFSGSSGNSVYVTCGEDAILIDAGKNCKTVENALVGLGSSLSKIKAIFVTHEHSDHVAALPVISRKFGIPIHVLAATANEMKEIPQSAVLHDALFDVQVGQITVSAFYTPHDSACSVGYTVCCGGHRFGIATDMGVITRNVVEGPEAFRAASGWAQERAAGSAPGAVCAAVHLFCSFYDLRGVNAPLS